MPARGKPVLDCIKLKMPVLLSFLFVVWLIVKAAIVKIKGDTCR